MKKVGVRYFAALRDQRGLSYETVETSAQTSQALYNELALRHGLKVDPRYIRFVKGDLFCEPETPIADGDTIEFLPPASGG